MLSLYFYIEFDLLVIDLCVSPVSVNASFGYILTEKSSNVLHRQPQVAGSIKSIAFKVMYFN